MRTLHTRSTILFFGITVLAFAIALPAAAVQLPQAEKPKTVTVMTRNLYVGADLLPAVAAIATGDPLQIIAAVSETWAKVQFTDFPGRAESLAREIAETEPDLIGLQEAELWRSQTPADFVIGNAKHVEYDFVQILLDALKRRGLRYEVVAEEIGLDAEFPGFLSPTAKKLSDIRLTDREVILARTDLELFNPQTGHFATNIEIPISPDFTFVLLRGWASVDAHVKGKTFRFLTTHLEADSELVRDAQAIEILLGPANTALPVILVADANSNANGDTTSAAYASWIGAGFTDAWFQAHPGEFVTTCCADELLLSPAIPVEGDDEGRIDLVLYRGAGDFGTLGIDLRGNQAATDRVFNGVSLIWPSDHAGVAATLEIHE
jgi:endonuclease/exonuclease/phosphatase family metal-dependent hydrolase